MISQENVKIIRETAEELFSRMTFPVLDINIEIPGEQDLKVDKDVVNLYINIQEPKFLIGQNGQTLVEIERILRVILNKKLQKSFYLKLDINDYHKQKVEYLKNLAKDSADEVALTKKEKILPPMSSYERRIVHMELDGRQDINTESRGDSLDRHIIILPK